MTHLIELLQLCTIISYGMAVELRQKKACVDCNLTDPLQDCRTLNFFEILMNFDAQYLQS